MSIIYSLIAKTSDKIMCEYTEYHGNFEQVSRGLLKKIQADHKATFSYDDAFYFHYINSGNMTYLCMCDNKYPQYSAFAFLEDIKKSFQMSFTSSVIEKAMSYSLNPTFKGILKEKMEYFNKHIVTNSGPQTVIQLKEAVIDTNGLLMETSDELSQRGEKVNMIVKKASTLQSESGSVLAQVRKSRHEVRMKRIRRIIYLIVFILFFAYFISIIACGGFDWNQCKSE